MSDPVECAYTIEGEGPPLMLIHGIGAARNTWRFAMPKLCEHFTVITYDLRGHGASPLPSGEFSLDDLVADLESVRQRAGIERAHFAGHSLGGMIGPAYARKYPDKVLSISLLSTAAFRSEEDSAKVWGVVKAMEERGISQVLETLSDRWFTDEFIEHNSDIVKARMQQVIGTDRDVFLNVFRIYAGTEMAPWLHEITQPCLVLTGENDGGCNPHLNKQIAKALPNSKLTIMPNYKHSLLLEAGREVASHIANFVFK